MKPAILALVFLAAFSHLRAQGFGRVIYVSPDSKLQAVISPGPNEVSHEYVIELQTPDGKQLARKGYIPPGDLYRSAGWTPDSNFFVFTTNASSTRFRSPTFVFVRALGRIFSLDDLVGPISSPAFELSPPCRFRSARVNPIEVATGMPEKALPLDVDLSTLKWE